eukprot:14836521-Heterocapsa_arctica.AAC.1
MPHVGGKGKESGKGKGNGVCRDFQQGTCTRGGACRFAHTEQLRQREQTEEPSSTPSAALD